MNQITSGFQAVLGARLGCLDHLRTTLGHQTHSAHQPSTHLSGAPESCCYPHQTNLLENFMEPPSGH